MWLNLTGKEGSGNLVSYETATDVFVISGGNDDPALSNVRLIGNLMYKILGVLGLCLVVAVGLLGWGILEWSSTDLISTQNLAQMNTEKSIEMDHPLAIEVMRKQKYPGSKLSEAEDLGVNDNYHKYIVSYLSDGLKIRGLLTVPTGAAPDGGWPGIVFNHGYISPEQYSTVGSYASYVDTLARAGYVILKPDYRGNAQSEGKPEGAYFDEAYTNDVLNALGSLQQDTRVNPAKIGIWGHSLGGNLTLRAMVVSPNIKAGVIWSGVVGSYQEMFAIWFGRNNFRPSAREMEARRHLNQDFVNKYGSPSANPKFWEAISPINYVAGISGPLQLQHSKTDATVPYEFSVSVDKAMKKSGKTVEFLSYEGADHNLSQVYNQAMTKTIDFFDKYLK